MLNIGKLSPGAAEYYVGEIASSAEDYYTGRGEAKGRWVGSLRDVLGLDGEVDVDHFRAVLAGRHPHTGVTLISSQGSAARAALARGDTPLAAAGLDEMVHTARSAAFLGVSHQHVRRLVKAGERDEAISQGQRVIALCDNLTAADPQNANLPRFRLALAYNIGWAHQARAEAAIESGATVEAEAVRDDLTAALRWLRTARDGFRRAATAGQLDSTVQENRISKRIEAVTGLLGER